MSIDRHENQLANLIIRHLPLSAYLSIWQAMQTFTQQRTAASCDEIWLVEHPPVFTLGQNAKAEHVLDSGLIPVVTTDRGGQVTYHGPGQIIAYLLLDINRKQFTIRQLVSLLEQSLINLLSSYEINAYAKREAPGVYVAAAKIAAIGLRIRKGYCYHGLSFNIEMDLAPFKQINPCGYSGLAVTQLADLINDKILDKEQVLAQLVQQLIQQLNYNQSMVYFESEIHEYK